jgi:outer membrane receptor protein involved in Fe transport
MRTICRRQYLRLWLITLLAVSLKLIVRLNNLTNRDYADRADYAFGSYRYFPGRGRELFAEVRYTP